ncbi:MAG: DUF499 domain-containing protein, partial [Terriglobales bacterium]
EEAFEIVRRRLFEPVRDEGARGAVCRAFANAYVSAGAELPTQTQEGRYYDRMVQAYPIHPELFDRLYEDWTTIEGFQRTRGVLKLMAKVIHRLWQDNNADYLILPSSLPLYDPGTRSELLYHLSPGWDAVVEGDIDGERAETIEIERSEPRFGQVAAARRAARTIFFGSAPAASATQPGTRGVDRAHVVLGCLQPGQTGAVFSDALNRLADRLHYLSSSGDRAIAVTRYWFDTMPNLRREMEDRKRRFRGTDAARTAVAEALQRTTAGMELPVHIFVKHGDVPDDETLRLAVLPPDCGHTKGTQSSAVAAAWEWLDNHGPRPRARRNRLLLLVADQAMLPRLLDAATEVLSWRSILSDAKDNRLNLDRARERQAADRLTAAERALPRLARECYRWLICPSQDAPEQERRIEAFALGSGQSLMRELHDAWRENDLVIEAWSPFHLREILKRFYWKTEAPAARAMGFWEDCQRSLYLPRLRDRAVLGATIRTGAASRDFFGVAYGRQADRYDGFQLGAGGAQLDGTLLLIEPAAAAAYEAARPLPTRFEAAAAPGGAPTFSSAPPPGEIRPPAASAPAPAPAAGPRHFHGSAAVDPVTAKMALVKIADEVVSQLISDPQATVKITLEISADFPEGGAAEDLKRAVSENASGLNFKTSEWE